MKPRRLTLAGFLLGVAAFGLHAAREDALATFVASCGLVVVVADGIAMLLEERADG